MATLTGEKGQVIELELRPKHGILATIHSDDGTSQEMTFPIQASMEFVGRLMAEYQEVMTSWFDTRLTTGDRKTKGD